MKMVFKLSQRNAEKKVCWNLNYCASNTHEEIFFWRCKHIRTKEVIYFERAAINMTFYALKPKRLFRRSRLCTLTEWIFYAFLEMQFFITLSGKFIDDNKNCWWLTVLELINFKFVIKFNTLKMGFNFY